MITRRSWMQGALLAAVEPRRRLGIQLYTVRDILTKDPERVFRALAKIGYREMEGRLAQIEGHEPLLAQLGLRWVNWMIPTPVITGQWDAWQKLAPNREPRLGLDQIIETAKKHGVENCGVSYLLPEERKEMKAFIDGMNKAGEKCRKAGLTLYYHNHAWEFDGKSGERPFDLLKAGLGKNVQFELDVFWLATAGQDPAKVITSCKGRVLSAHLKDIAKDAPVSYSERDVPKAMFRDAGDGRLDWKAVLPALQSAGAKHYFVEQDYPAGDPLESARRSYEFLQRA